MQQLNVTTSVAAGDQRGQVRQRTFQRSIFRLADQKLVEFSKQPQAWQVVFEVLLNCSQLDDQSVFQAASILKNKAMFDFVAFRMSLDPASSNDA